MSLNSSRGHSWSQPFENLSSSIPHHQGGLDLFEQTSMKFKCLVRPVWCKLEQQRGVSLLWMPLRQATSLDRNRMTCSRVDRIFCLKCMYMRPAVCHVPNIRIECANINSGELRIFPISCFFLHNPDCNHQFAWIRPTVLMLIVRVKVFSDRGISVPAAFNRPLLAQPN